MHAGHVAAAHRKGKRSGSSPRRAGAESGKKQKSSTVKRSGPLGWVPIITDASSWVLGLKGEVCGDIRSHDTAIVSGSLFAHAIPATSLDVGDHLPRRSDSIFLHPDTMHLCGLAIAQPVAVRNVSRPNAGIVICKPWPFRKIMLDSVALSQVVLRSCVCESGEEGEEGEGEGGRWGRVEVWSVPSSSLRLLAKEMQLRPRSDIDSSILNDSFKNYTRSLLEGSYVCEGNRVSVLFCNEDLEFIVENVIPDSRSLEPNTGTRLSFNTSQNLTTLLEDSLQLDMSGLCLEGRGGEKRGGSHSPHSPARLTVPSQQQNIVTSTPWMDVDEAPVRSGSGSGQVDSLLLEPSQNADRKGGVVSLECQMQGLGLDDGCENVGGGGRGREDEGDMVEAVVCKVTPKTRIVFLERDLQGGSKSHGVTMSDIGGLSTQKQLLRELVIYPLQTPAVEGIQFPRGVLLHGPSGVGKSLLALSLSSETAAHCVSLSPPDYTSSDGTSKLQSLFKEAREKCPCLILLEDLHSLCVSSEGSTREHATTATLAAFLDSLHTAPPSRHVVVMGTTNRIEAVDPCLRRPGRFDREIEVTTPTAPERREVLEVLFRGVAYCLRAGELEHVADCAHGYTGSDLRAVCMHAQHIALRRRLECARQREGGGGEEGEGVVVRSEDVKSALREVRPSAMREVTVEVPKVLWSDIGGQEDVKQRLKEAVEWPLQHPEAFSRLGIAPPKGVLLFGPPGCSKTMIARALATESGLNFIAVKGPELFSKWVGDSERAVRQVFQRARQAAPSIVFFDEIDALAVHRKNEGSSVADRVLAQLLTEMDGVEMLKDVLIVAATNRPDMIDKALLRPGRIDRMIYVPLPSDETRKEIFQINFRKTPVASDVCLEQLVSETQGFSGAEVVALCQEAALCAMHENISVEKVSFRHFQQALKTISPQIQPSTVASYERYSKTLQ